MGSIVVLSPHSDDGVLSLGASMSRWVRDGRHVELLTVLALNPESVAATSGWDRRGGFRTEGEAARVRQDEDRAACSTLGVTPRWLPFGSVDFDRHGDDEDVRAAVLDAIEDADVVLLPGFPLTHPDHSWLHGLLADRLPRGIVGLYAEQPYTFRSHERPFAPSVASHRDRVVKWRAVRAYRSQLPLLAMQRSPLRGPLRLSWANERLAWPDGRDDLPI
jgi:LmbE family N-acetylglucosaminyl deacetylase